MHWRYCWPADALVREGALNRKVCRLPKTGHFTDTEDCPTRSTERLKAFARTRGVSVNKLVEELTTVALAQADAENRYLLRKARGKPSVGLRLLDKLDGKVR